MLFINLRGLDRRPLGGLEDAAFLAALKRAASSFPGASLGANGRARAYLVENDRAKATNGEEFTQRLGADAPALMLLRL